MFATSLDITNFLASEDWLEKLRKRLDLTCKKVCGESASVGPISLFSLLVNYETKNIFNADETELFYKCLPNRTLTYDCSYTFIIFYRYVFFVKNNMN